MPTKIIVVMSNDVQFLTNLKEKCNGFEASVQRRHHADNATWFQFLLDTTEDGRLVPKKLPQRRSQFKLNVCHVWQADSVVAAVDAAEEPDGGCCSYTVRLPRRPPKPPDEIFAIAININNVEEYQQFVTSYQQETNEITSKAMSVPTQGSPNLLYKAVREVDFRSCIAEQDVVHVREVLGDVHLLYQQQQAERKAAKNATDGPILLFK
jgi:hypothetical protein